MYKTMLMRVASVFMALVILGSTSLSAQGNYNGYYSGSSYKEKAGDFDKFLRSCSLEERIALMQALGGLDEKIPDSCFGSLEGLPYLSQFAKNKKSASKERPLKPKTFNEVLPKTVEDAIAKGYLDVYMFTVKNIKKELVWRRYNKMNYIWHDTENIDYHEDIVAWVAKKNDIEKKYLGTYALEREVALKQLEKIWDKLTPEQREELLIRIEKETKSIFDNKSALALMSGGAAVAALSTTVAFTGFTFYTTLTTMIATVAGWFGLTLPFACYIYTTTTVGILAGPIGWAAIGIMWCTSAFMMGWSESDTVTRFVIMVNVIKAKHMAQ